MLGGVCEQVVCFLELVEGEVVGCHCLRVQAARTHHVQQVAHGVAVHQTHVDVHVRDPHGVNRQLYRLAVHTRVRNVAVGANDLGAGLEGLRHAHGLNRHIHAQAVGGEGLNLLDKVRISCVDLIGCSQFQSLVHAVIVHIDGNHTPGTAQVRRHDRAQTHRTCADNSHRIARLGVAVENTHLETGRKRIREEENVLVREPLGNHVHRRLGVRNAHILGLGAVNHVPENPADTAYGLAV